MNSKTTFDRNDTSLGCIDTLSVAPPYTASASWRFTFPLLAAFSLAKSEEAKKQKSDSKKT